MQEKKGKVNKQHPDYQEYAEKFYTIWNEMSQELDAAQKKWDEERPCLTYDDPYSSAIRRKYHKQLKELQKKYSYLFTD